MPKAVLFDLDGVLVKSEEAWFRAVAEAGVKFRGKAVTRAEFAPTFGQGTAADIEGFKFNCTREELDAFYVEAFLKQLEHVWVNPAAKTVLAALEARGISSAVVTNSVGTVTSALLARAELTFAVKATSDRVAHAKPAPDLVQLALKELGAEAATSWMVGDSKYDRGAAKAAGVFFCGLDMPGDARLDSLVELVELLEVAEARAAQPERTGRSSARS
jgi:phosphoglycolate phosphatase/AHBA synthesis associated protein